MDDHTYNGIPVSKMPLSDIYDCLSRGFVFTGESEPATGPDAEAVRLRLEVELIRRRLGLPIRGE